MGLARRIFQFLLAGDEAAAGGVDDGVCQWHIVGIERGEVHAIGMKRQGLEPLETEVFGLIESDAGTPRQRQLLGLADRLEARRNAPDGDGFGILAEEA